MFNEIIIMFNEIIIMFNKIIVMFNSIKNYKKFDMNLFYDLDIRKCRELR